MHSANMLAEVVDLVVFSSSLEKTPAIPVSGKSCRGSSMTKSLQADARQTQLFVGFSIIGFCRLIGRVLQSFRRRRPPENAL